MSRGVKVRLEGDRGFRLLVFFVLYFKFRIFFRGVDKVEICWFIFCYVF